MENINNIETNHIFVNKSKFFTYLKIDTNYERMIKEFTEDCVLATTVH